MKVKYHINSKGIPAVCRAKEGNCPYGGEDGKQNHFPTFEEAEVVANADNQDEFGILRGMNEDELYSSDVVNDEPTKTIPERKTVRRRKLKNPRYDKDRVSLHRGHYFAEHHVDALYDKITDENLTAEDAKKQGIHDLFRAMKDGRNRNDKDDGRLESHDFDRSTRVFLGDKEKWREAVDSGRSTIPLYMKQFKESYGEESLKKVIEHRLKWNISGDSKYLFNKLDSTLEVDSNEGYEPAWYSGDSGTSIYDNDINDKADDYGFRRRLEGKR